jgi:hypothetical protein
MGSAKPLSEAEVLRGEGVRVTSDGRLAVLDIIRKRKTPYTSPELRRLLARWPDLRAKITYHQFPGRRQNATPVLPASDVPFFLKILASKAKAMKRPRSRPTAPLLARVARRQLILFAENPAPSPYGWRWDPQGTVLCPVLSEIHTTRYCRKLQAFGDTLREIVAQLERDGIQPRGGRWTEDLVLEVMEFDHSDLWRALEALLDR